MRVNLESDSLQQQTNQKISHVFDLLFYLIFIVLKNCLVFFPEGSSIPVFSQSMGVIKVGTYIVWIVRKRISGLSWENRAASWEELKYEFGVKERFRYKFS